jgi:hypothetical protein
MVMHDPLTLIMCACVVVVWLAMAWLVWTYGTDSHDE